MLRTVLLTTAIALAPVAGAAQTIPAGAPSPQKAQQGILSYAIEDSVAEVQLCQLALQKSQTPAVRTFAQHMIESHAQMVRQAVPLARQAGGSETAEIEPSDDGMVKLAYLSCYSGHAFDEDFMRMQVEDHMNDIGIFRNALETLGTGPVAQFAQATLPQLEDHLRMAQSARDAVAAQDQSH